MHFNCQKREKKEKKCKQSITNSNPTMICLHAPLHVKEGMVAYLVIQQMTRFGHRKASHVPS